MTSKDQEDHAYWLKCLKTRFIEWEFNESYRNYFPDTSCCKSRERELFSLMFHLVALLDFKLNFWDYQQIINERKPISRIFDEEELKEPEVRKNVCIEEFKFTESNSNSLIENDK